MAHTVTSLLPRPDLAALVAEARGLLLNDPGGAETCLDAALGLLPSEGSSRVAGTLITARLQRLTAFIDDHIAEALSRKRLASLVGLSPSQLSRIFKAHFGIGLHAHIRTHKVELALARMRRDQPSLAQLALDCGFSDQSHLCRAFRRTLGTTPGRWASQQHRAA